MPGVEWVLSKCHCLDGGGAGTPPQHAAAEDCWASPGPPHGTDFSGGGSWRPFHCPPLVCGAAVSSGDPAGRGVPSLRRPYRFLGISCSHPGGFPVFQCRELNHDGK